jgi:hypothetical protein
MVYFWKKGGQVYHHAALTKEEAMEAARQTDGVTKQPDAEAADERFEGGGRLARFSRPFRPFPRRNPPPPEPSGL